MRRLAIVTALLLSGSAAAASPDRIRPAPETTPMKPMGAADRTANGPSPLATPPVDVGATPDPDEAPPPPDNKAPR